VEAKTNYTFVGLSVIILLISLCVTALWLSFGFDQTAYQYYVVYTKESVSGLNEEALVKYNGVKVGYVEEVSLSNDHPGTVKILLKIAKDTPITKSTYATMMAQGITGSSYLNLAIDGNNRDPIKAAPNQPLPEIPYHSSFFYRLESNFDLISQQMENIFSARNAENFSKIISNLQALSETIKHNNDNINQLLIELPKISNELSSTIDNVRKMSDDVAQAGRNVTSTMKSARFTVDKFNQQAIPPAVDLINRLNQIAASIEQISQDMNQNPAIIIRGKAETQPGPGE
jgi:phospholipid/cholesterol/gamma-HCH transport system substrate-binding protein